MNRRQALKSIGVAAALQLSPAELFALARGLHTRLQESDEGERYLFGALDAEANEIVTVATELILPETDTPGARSCRVNEFIDLLLTEWFTEGERRTFLRGVREMDERALRAHGRRFVGCTEAEQVAILKGFEAEAIETLATTETTRRARRRAMANPEAPFFTVLKWLTLYGYFTSEAAMEKELEHEVFPGTYEGCAPIKPAR